ncbi:MarC family protein [Chelatococcus sp. YT9]|uniref:MarC family protein n=1 Tax=Chelatococcus sp. YT9 TaxID=2835635 RepID=UPI001BCADED9|nr:MarC family protein [Chelatococcus sp. YT9]MBS7701524.1 MarC family protein [Chelatococcus sp. YT9]
MESTSVLSMFTFSFASMFAMVNPIGMTPVFLEQTKDRSVSERHLLAYRVAAYGVALLVLTLFFGSYVLQFFGVSLADVQIAGGLFVFYTAWTMLVASPARTSDQKGRSDSIGGDIAFFPLTIPITAGAGSLAVTLSLSSRIARGDSHPVAGYVGATLGICLVFITVALCYRFSDKIFARVGAAATGAITRLTAFLLLAIGVAVTWDGLKQLILSLRAG